MHCVPFLVLAVGVTMGLLISPHVLFPPPVFDAMPIQYGLSDRASSASLDGNYDFVHTGDMGFTAEGRDDVATVHTNTLSASKTVAANAAEQRVKSERAAAEASIEATAAAIAAEKAVI